MTYFRQHTTRRVLPCALTFLLTVTSATAAVQPASAGTVTAHESHDIDLRSGRISYQASAGFLDVTSKPGNTPGKLFYIAYTAPAEGDHPRPLIFLFNGGPGAASAYLNIGGYGPKRIATGTPAGTAPAPFKLRDNPDSLIGTADLVFIDAMGTGYSHAVTAKKAKAFWSVDADIASYADAITSYVSRFHRWNAPKYLIGESYGGTRAAMLADTLSHQGMSLNGIIMMSPILNFFETKPNVAEGYVNYLPSFAATAWYHHRLKSQPKDLPAFLKKVRHFALTDYLPALLKGDRIRAEEEADVAEKLSACTGISKAIWLKSHLRLSAGKFATHLLGTQAMTGMLDSRVTAPLTGTPLSPPFDAADQAISGAFTAGINRVLAEELNIPGYKPYKLSVPGLDYAWDWRHQAPDGEILTTPDAGLELAEAMQLNPEMQVLIMHGYFDLSTPFFATEYDLAHMALPATERNNLHISYYPAGHMIYLSPNMQQKSSDDIRTFIRASSEQP